VANVGGKKIVLMVVILGSKDRNVMRRERTKRKTIEEKIKKKYEA
jgi:hypothetical protein